MTSPIFSSAFVAVARAIRRHQGAPPQAKLSLTRLIAGEFVLLLGWLRQPRRVLGAFAGVAAVLLALSSATPGPVAPVPLLVLLSVLAAFAGAMGARPRRAGGTPRRN